jgi:AcrR family transcriptional regulator
MVSVKKATVDKPPPRRGAPAKGEPSGRERILATASELFYRDGIRAIGIDTVIAASGVSKATLYRTFESKDALIAAFVADRDRLFWVWWDNIAAKHADDPRTLLDALLMGVARQIGGEGYRGCPFLNAATEFPDNTHPGRVVARANKDEMRARLAVLCARIGVANSERVGWQLSLLINGAYATGQLGKDADLARCLVGAAAHLIAETHGLD